MSQNAKAHDRIRHLEDLVMQMMNRNTPPNTDSNPASVLSNGPPSTSAYLSPLDPVLTAETDGHLQVQGNESQYVGSTHWSTILDNIQELKNVIATEENDQPIEASDPDTLFGASRPPSLAKVLQVLPPKVQVDRLLSIYFNAKYAIMPILHVFQFQRQYEAFWLNPLETSPLWIAMLFSIMGMAEVLRGTKLSKSNTPVDFLAPPKEPYITSAAQCLILGGFTRPRRFVIEALLLFSLLKYTASSDPSREVGLIFSVISRLAFRMGYHRDPSHFPHINTFDSEMRRRSWNMIKMFDLMISFQLGLPANINVDTWDTEVPSNLHDGDFDEGIMQLPPSRLETEITPMLYFVVKGRLMTTFGKVCQHALSVRPQPEDSIRAIEAELQEVYESIPVPLKYRPMSQSFADEPASIMFRLNCEFLYQKSVCILHRKYMAQGSKHSRHACVSAAMAILGHLADIHKEFQEGGQMEYDRWMVSSFTMNDFVLAAMMLCLALSLKTKEGLTVHTDPESRFQLDMLKQSYFICLEFGNTSREGKRVANALGIMLSKLEPDFAPVVKGASQVTEKNNLLGLSSMENAPEPADNEPFGSLLDGLQQIDWAFLDQYLMETNPSEVVTQTFSGTPVPGFGETAVGVRIATA